MSGIFHPQNIKSFLNPVHQSNEAKKLIHDENSPRKTRHNAPAFPHH